MKEINIYTPMVDTEIIIADNAVKFKWEPNLRRFARSDLQDYVSMSFRNFQETLSR